MLRAGAMHAAGVMPKRLCNARVREVMSTASSNKQQTDDNDTKVVHLSRRRNLPMDTYSCKLLEMQTCVVESSKHCSTAQAV